MSLRFPILCLALIAAAAQPGPAQTSYRDPLGRFTLRIPAGWSTVQLNNDAVQFAHGAAYVTMLSLPGADPALTLRTIGESTAKQWKNFTEARRGAANFGGGAGQYVTYSGINPIGSESYIQLLGMTDGSLTYLLMKSAPKADFTRLKTAFDGIEESFRLTGPAKVPDSGPPAPAGAIETSSAAPGRAPATVPAGAQSVQGAHAKAQAGGVEFHRMKLVRIVDERGFERPMTALTLLVPVDWQVQGGVQYGQGAGCHANLVRLTFHAESPDGRLAFELFPGNTWQWTDDPNMRNMMQASNQQQAVSASMAATSCLR